MKGEKVDGHEIPTNGGAACSLLPPNLEKLFQQRRPLPFDNFDVDGLQIPSLPTTITDQVGRRPIPPVTR